MLTFYVQVKLERAAASAAASGTGDAYTSLLREDRLDGLSAAISAYSASNRETAKTVMGIGMAVVMDSRFAISPRPPRRKGFAGSVSTRGYMCISICAVVIERSRGEGQP